jgi:hypothetical protein
MVVMGVVLLGLAALVATATLAQEGPYRSSKPPAAAGSVRAAAPVAAVALQPGVTVGAPLAFDNLTLFPIYSAVQRDVGPIVTLEQALAARTAEVRELGDGAEVNKLVIDNRGKESILVLAGTVIEGGNQDRQVGQDVIISAKTVAPIDAYCVEHGRWDGVREGEATGGKFTAVGGLAPTKVRAAAQYKEDQTEVWSAVAAVNAFHDLAPASGTLAATLDDERLAAERSAIAAKVSAALPRHPSLVGIAWAVDGEVRGLRWFMNQRLFSLYRSALIDASVLEAIGARQVARAAGKPLARKKVEARAVVAFVREIDRAAREEKATGAANVNEYRKAPKGAASRAMMKPAPAASAESVTHDYAAY